MEGETFFIADKDGIEKGIRAVLSQKEVLGSNGDKICQG